MGNWHAHRNRIRSRSQDIAAFKTRHRRSISCYFAFGSSGVSFLFFLGTLESCPSVNLSRRTYITSPGPLAKKSYMPILRTVTICLLAYPTAVSRSLIWIKWWIDEWVDEVDQRWSGVIIGWFMTSTHNNF